MNAKKRKGLVNAPAAHDKQQHLLLFAVNFIKKIMEK